MNECYRSSFYGTVLNCGYSDHHYFEFVQNDLFGLSFFLDGILQSTECDQSIYHEKLVLAGFEERSTVRNVLIVGGAGGGLVHQLARRISLDRLSVTVVDIDPTLCEVANRILSSWNAGEFSHRNVRILYEDGRDFLRRQPDQYDLVFLDLGDPVRETKSSEFYSPKTLVDLAECLRPSGVVAFHSAQELTPTHAFVSAVRRHAVNGIGKIAHFPLYLRSFEHAWMFNVLKKISL